MKEIMPIMKGTSNLRSLPRTLWPWKKRLKKCN